MTSASDGRTVCGDWHRIARVDVIEPGRATGDLAEAHDEVKGPDGRIEILYLAMSQTPRATEPANDRDLAVLQNPTNFSNPGSQRSRRAMSLSLEARRWPPPRMYCRWAARRGSPRWRSSKEPPRCRRTLRVGSVPGSTGAGRHAGNPVGDVGRTRVAGRTQDQPVRP